MNTNDLTAPLIDCLRLIVQINRRLDEMRKLSVDEEDESIVILAESAQDNLRDVRHDIQRIRIILESLPEPEPASS